MSDAGSVASGESGEPIVIKPKMLKKQKYFASLHAALDEYDQGFLVNADNVGSKQIQQIRAATRHNSLMVFGKNTQMKKAISQKVGENPDLEKLLPHLVGNVGFVFTKGNLKEVRDIISQNKVPAPARSGAVAQCGVTIPSGLTGMEPTQTSFFQALNIPTKISKGQIEIIGDVNLFSEGDKVSSSEVALLAKMGMKPFTFGLSFEQVLDKGALYSPDVLDITDDHLLNAMRGGLAKIAAASLTLGVPTQASVPHSIMGGLKKMVAFSLVSEYCIGPAEKLKAILDDPEALAALAAAAAAGGGGAAPAAEEKKEESDEEEEEEMGMLCFLFLLCFASLVLLRSGPRLTLFDGCHSFFHPLSRLRLVRLNTVCHAYFCSGCCIFHSILVATNLSAAIKVRPGIALGSMCSRPSIALPLLSLAM